MLRTLIASLALIQLYACSPTQGDLATVHARIRHAIHRTVIIETLPGSGRESRILDSATLHSNDEHIEFRIPLDDETPCRLHVINTDLSVHFILHPGEIFLEGDIIIPSEMAVVSSPINTPLLAFLSSQRDRMETYAPPLDSIQRATNTRLQKVWQTRYDSLLMVVQQAYRRYADTVTSPGAFLYVYTYVDYGRDYDSLKAFILRTESRFPKSASVTRLRERTLDFLKTFEVELEVGDSILPLALPDAMGHRLPVTAPGRHLLVNFWSTWCNPCIAILDEQKRLEPWTSTGRLQVVNIALDSEKDTWSFLTSTRQVPGMNLIDTGVWEGAVIREWRIDSIPFNWLLDPRGRIIRKAIPKDSLVSVVKAAITD